MATFDARVSFYESQDPAVDAVLSVTGDRLTLEAEGRLIGEWSMAAVAPEIVGERIVVSVEGERLVLETSRPEALWAALHLGEPSNNRRARGPRGLSALFASKTHDTVQRKGRHVAERTRSIGHPSVPAQPDSPPEVSIDLSVYDEIGMFAGEKTAGEGHIGSLRNELVDRENEIAVIQTQLRWVEELVPRRLHIPLRADEHGLGVVQGVLLKERRPLVGSDGLQPWVTVDSGNVYVTTMRLVFSGVTDLEFEYDEINKKGASRTGLLLGVSSRAQTHILAGPGDRLAVVLTAAEKLARGVEPTAPFRTAIASLTAEIAGLEEGMAATTDVTPQFSGWA